MASFESTPEVCRPVVSARARAIVWCRYSSHPRCCCLSQARAQTGEIRYVYDEVGRLVAVVNPSGEAATYETRPAVSSRSCFTAVYRTSPLGSWSHLTYGSFDAAGSYDCIAKES